MILKYVISDACNQEANHYAVLKFEAQKNLLVIGGKTTSVEFIRNIVYVFSKGNLDVEPYYPQKGKLRFNVGISLPVFLNVLDNIKNAQDYFTNQVKSIERLM